MVYRHHLLAMWEGMSEGTVGIRITEWTTPCSSDVRGKEKQPKTTRKKEVSDRSRYFFRYRTANASTGPHQRSTRLRRRNAQFNRRPLTYLTTNTKDRRRSGGPALSSVLNETEKGECAIQPSSPDLSRCEYGDRRRSGGPALSYSVSQENLGSYSYSRPQRR